MNSKIWRIFGFLHRLEKRFVYDCYGKTLSGTPTRKSLD